jgi:hypothetical protein
LPAQVRPYEEMKNLILSKHEVKEAMALLVKEKL